MIYLVQKSHAMTVTNHNSKTFPNVEIEEH